MFCLLFAIGLIAILYFYFVKPVQYWKNRQIPQHSTTKIWLDFFAAFMPRKGIAEQMQNAYNDFSGKRYGGMYQLYTPAILLRDPALIQEINIKNFDSFRNHSVFIPEDNEDILNNSVFNLKDDKWRNMRSILSPSFTSSKLKTIFPLITECAEQFVNYFDKNIEDMKTVEIKSIFSKVSMDVIATSAYGIACNSFDNPENDFFQMGKALTNFQDLMMNVRLMLLFLLPKVAKALNVKFSNPKYVNYFKNIIVQNIESREKHGIVRPDMIQILLEARKKSEPNQVNEKIDDEDFAVINEDPSAATLSNKIRISDEDITAQAFLFFLAGFDTVATTMSFAAYELALNPDIQEKLYQEILENQVNFGESPNYESLTKMNYLDMVISESLRKYPSSVVLDRVCNKPYTIQPETFDESPVHIETGHLIWISVIGLHRDPLFYPDPDRFDPERFSDENKVNITSGTYLPFGVGPRHCIGNRFALMEIKLVLYYLLSKFKLIVVEKTQIPLKMAKSQISMDAEDGYWLGLQKRIKG